MKGNRKPVLVGAAILGIAVLIAGGVVTARIIGGRTQPTEKRVKVSAKRVVNGHYVKVDDNDKLIYAGIRSPYENEPFHEEAKQRNAELVVGQELRLYFDEGVTRDDDGRLVAYAFVGDLFVNGAMVREGLAYVRLTSQVRRYADVLLAAQIAAREEGRGLWSRVLPSDADRYVADAKHGDFHRPACEAVARIKPERRVELARKEDAFDQGFAPCNKCGP